MHSKTFLANIKKGKRKKQNRYIQLYSFLPGAELLIPILRRLWPPSDLHPAWFMSLRHLDCQSEHWVPLKAGPVKQTEELGEGQR